MPKLFTPEEIKKKYVGLASHICALELLKKGMYGKKMTRANFAEHKKCIREKMRKLVEKRLAGLTLPSEAEEFR